VKAREDDDATKASPSQKAERLKQLFKDYNSVGITSIGDRDANPEVLPLYQKLRGEGGLTVRVAISQHIDTAGPLSEIQASIRRVAEHRLFREKDPLLHHRHQDILTAGC
jgi:predicted amidohydrolase YtcJ